jgi:nickel-dependent lactate racemase
MHKQEREKMKISIPYGSGEQIAEISSIYPIEVIDPPKKQVTTDVMDYIQQALDAPIGKPRLEDMVRPRTRVTILVNDQTRPGPHAEMAGAWSRA